MIALLSTAFAAGCEQTSIGDLTDVPAPAVFVLGERMGTQPDLVRATRIINKLHASAAVTVALAEIPARKQEVLDRYVQGTIPTSDLPGLLDWESASGFPFAPYEKVLSANWDTDLLGVGVPIEPKPAEQPVPIPPGYIAVLQDGMAGHFMPVALESRFVQTVTWYDHRVARTAIEAWDGEGYLVILADRTHVEGGKGIGWQAQRMTEAPVHSVLLYGPGSCYPDDRWL